MHRVQVFGMAAIVVTALLGACGGDDRAVDTVTSTDATDPPTTTKDEEGELSGSYDVGGRALAITCLGTGSPTVVFEPGEGEGQWAFSSLQREVAQQVRACTYDRANVGESSEAPTPRTTDQIVDDVHALLAAAGVEGPYVLVGTSAGATISLHHAKRFPEEVAGVLAVNPVPLASQWEARAYPLLSESEVELEVAYYDGANGEQLDYNASSEAHEAVPAPDGVPLILLHSDETQCDGRLDGPCGKTADLYITLGEEYAAAWPGARFEAVAEGHSVETADPELVLARITELIEG
jgi:pimeloyl-ACP methyl ester carboxylesterase